MKLKMVLSLFLVVFTMFLTFSQSDWTQDASGLSYQSGSVGIGTTANDAFVDIKKPANLSTINAFQVDASSATGNEFVVDENGNVGIGNINPTHFLEVVTQGVGEKCHLLYLKNTDTSTGNFSAVKMQSGSSNNYGVFGYTGSEFADIPDFNDRAYIINEGNGIAIQAYSDGSDIRFYTDTDLVERLNVSRNGFIVKNTKVGIGTSDPGDFLLNVNGNVYTNGDFQFAGDIKHGPNQNQTVFKSYTDTWRIAPYGTGNTSSNLVTVGSNYTAEALNVKFKTYSDTHLATDNGNVGIGTTTPGTNKLYVKGKTYVEGDVQVTGTITAQAIAVSGISPIGSIVAWHKNMPGTPALPYGWVECNGAEINVPGSPYHGATAPDLNNKYQTYHSKGAFLRGHTTSGQMQNDAFQGHAHEWTYDNRGGSGEYRGIGYDSTNTRDAVKKPTTLAGYDAVRYGTETRPVNFSVVWIMRVL